MPCYLSIYLIVCVNLIILHLELTEFPKIDLSDDSGDEDNETKEMYNDEILSNSISSLSIDKASLNQANNTNTGMSNIQQTSDYESLADCMHRSLITADANTRIAESFTAIKHNDEFSIQSSMRVNDEGSSLSDDHQRRRKNGVSTATTVIYNDGKTLQTTTNNETPLLSHLFGTHNYKNDSHLN